MNESCGNNNSWSSSCYSLPGAVFTVIPVALIILVIVLGNGLVVIAVVKDKKLKKMLQNWLIVSLAFADFFVGLLIMPLTLTYEILGEWTFGSILCELWLALDVLFVTASILNLCAISLDRYWAVTDPLQYARNRTKRRMLIMIAVAWTVSLAISLPPLVGWRGPKVEGQCLLSTDLAYVLYSALGSFWIPVIVVIVVYYRIFLIVRGRMRKKMKEVAMKEATLAAVAASKINITQKPSKNDVEPTPPGTPTISGSPSFVGNQPSLALPPTPQLPNGISGPSSSSSDTFSPGCESLTLSTTPLRRDFNQRNFDTMSETPRDTPLATPSMERPRKLDFNLFPRATFSFQGIKNLTPRVRKFTNDMLPMSKRSLPAKFNSEITVNGNANRSPLSLKAEVLKDSPTRCVLNKHYEQKKKQQKKKDRQATIVLGFVLVAFLVCWLPFFTLYVLGAFKLEAPELVFDIFFWFGYCNSALNPVIYTICNHEFRAAFYRILFKTSS